MSYETWDPPSDGGESDRPIVSRNPDQTRRREGASGDVMFLTQPRTGDWREPTNSLEVSEVAAETVQERKR